MARKFPGRLKDGFGIRTAGRLSGLEPMMVDYLCRQKVLVPKPAHPGRGRDRIYSFGDVVMLRVLKHLLDCGISVSKLRKGLEAVRKRHGEIRRESVPERYLVTNGKMIFFRASANALEEVENGQLAFAFVIELEKVRDEVSEEERRLA
jgi:DNA-binding transcriptional MerR regulator